MNVNGKDMDLGKTGLCTIIDLLEYFQLSKNQVAIEKNGMILEKSNWDEEKLNPNDSIEIIKFVGGG